MRREAASSNTYPKISEISGNRRKGYVDHPNDRSKHTCLTHGPGNSSYGLNVFGNYGYKFSKIRPTKDCRYYPVTRGKFNRQQDNSGVVNNAVD